MGTGKILRRSDFLILAFLVFALVGYATVYIRGFNKPPIRSDGVGYYAYLPSYLLFNDLSFRSLGPVLQNHGYTNTPEVPGWTGIKPYASTGRPLNKYLVGEALMILPFFLVGHVLTLAAGGAMDGFSSFYQHSAGLAGVFYGILGLLFLKRILERHFSRRVVTATLTTLFVGTNLFHYVVYDSIFSHAFSFCVFTGLLLLVPRWYVAPSCRTSILLGGLAGLVPLLRFPNAVGLLAVPLFGLSSAGDLKQRLAWLRSHSGRIVLVALAAAAVLSLQCVIWKISTGRWFLYPYQGEHFNFLAPRIIPVLFSVRKGLFFWSPILLISLAGLWTMRKRASDYFLATAVVLPLMTYVIAGWECWWYGGSFGHRAFIEFYGLFAFPLACLFSAIRRRPARIFFSVIVAALITISFIQMFQYWKGIIPFDQTTWHLYRRVFLRF